ncbi:MAG: ribonuclease P protein component [bacterium]
MLPKRARLSRESEIRQTLKQKQYQQRHPLLYLVAKDNHREISRLVVVTSKKLGKANVRNRLRRIVGAAFATVLPKIKNNLDVAVFPSTQMIGKDSNKAQVALDSCLRKIGVI